MEKTTAHDQTPQHNLKEGEVFLPSNVSLHILFSPHRTKEDLGDFGRFKNLVRQADIFIPESPGWHETLLTKWNRVSKGDSATYLEAKQVIPFYAEQTGADPSFELAQIEATFNSWTKIVMIDTQSEAVNTKIAHLTNSFYDPLAPSLELELSSIDNFCIEYARIQGKREDDMLLQIGQSLVKTIEPNPKLRNKNPVAVLMCLGSSHERFARLLENNIPATSGALPSIIAENLNQLFIPTDVLSNIYKDGLVPSQEERERLLLEGLAYKIIGLWTSQNAALIEQMLKASKSLSNQEIVGLFESSEAVLSGEAQPDLFPSWQKILPMLQTG